METRQQKHIEHRVDGQTRVFIMASIRLYREGLSELLKQVSSLSVVGATGTYADFMEQWSDVGLDVLLLDINLPNSLEIAQRIYSSESDIKIVALSVGEISDGILSWAEAGISGFITENGSLQDMIDTIHSAKTGQLYCDPSVAGKLLQRLAVLGVASTMINGLKRLTSREQVVLELIERGLSNKEISRKLNIEIATVKSHVHNLMEKLNVHRRERAAAYLRDHQNYRTF